MIIENLTFNSDDVWYHGCSKSELLKSLNKPSCKYPLFLAKNIKLAHQYSMLAIDKNSGRTGSMLKSTSDSSRNYVYVVTLNYPKCKVFNIEKDSKKLDALYNGTFSFVSQLCKNNFNDISLLPRTIFDSLKRNYLESEDYIEEICGHAIHNPSDQKFLSMVRDDTLIKIMNDLIKAQIEDGDDDFDDEAELFYIGLKSISFKDYLKCIDFLKAFSVRHKEWTPD